MPGLRIGTVSFLNAHPLTAGLDDVVADVPSGLTERFLRGSVDVALLPVYEALRVPECPILAAGAIASPGPVDSVLLFSRGEPGASKSVCLDEHSRTSNALTRLLFAELFGTAPEFLLPEGSDRRARADCYLLIGDRALTEQREGLVVTDLATAWRQLTGLPFCFAVWVARDSACAEEAMPILREARDLGLARRADYARAGAAELGLPFEDLLTYLTKRITYSFGEPERKAVEEFRRLLTKHRLL